MSLRKFNNYDMPGRPPVLAWNPLAMRCDRVDKGCANCWHLRNADRLAVNPMVCDSARAAYAGVTDWCPSKTIHAPMPAGRVVAVQFMGDLWHDKIPRECRSVILERIRKSPDTTFLLLTKRFWNLRGYAGFGANCWLGVSSHGVIGDSVTALRRVPAASHIWLSLEPLLVRAWPAVRDLLREADTPRLVDWITAGPETGPGARPCNPDWIREIADWCQGAGIPFYDKRAPGSRGFTRREWPAEFPGGAK
jgi:protein gp37